MKVLNWTEAINRIAELEVSWGFSVENLANALDRPDLCYAYPPDNDTSLKKHWVHKWLCTDTMVGLAIYTLDGRVVAVSSQSARKADEVIEFLSLERANYVKVYLENFRSTDTIPIVTNLDETIDDGWFR